MDKSEPAIAHGPISLPIASVTWPGLPATRSWWVASGVTWPASARVQYVAADGLERYVVLSLPSDDYDSLINQPAFAGNTGTSANVLGNQQFGSWWRPDLAANPTSFNISTPPAEGVHIVIDRTNPKVYRIFVFQFNT